MPVQLSEAVKQQLARLAPVGYDAANACVIACTAVIQRLDALSPDDSIALATIKAQAPSVVTNGSPTLMRVLAWMVHEGVNRNGDGFVKEELALAAQKITPRTPLVMDWNHAAILGGDGKVIGIWTKADYAFDQKALDGKGAWGLLVEGVMFAWLYPEIATKMLAEQERHGAVDFSMACIPASVEYAQLDGKHVSWLHNPVFFTNAALDVRPGDAAANGRVREADTADDVEAQLRNELLTLASMHELTESLGLRLAALEAAKETPMPDTKKKFLSLVKSDVVVEGLVAVTMTAAVSEQFATETLTPARIAKLETLTLDHVVAALSKVELAADSTIEAVAGVIDDTKLIELQTANTALQADVARLTTELSEASTQLAAATARLAEIDAVASTAAKALQLIERMKALPESYAAAHTELPVEERTKVEVRWADMTDEQWLEKVDDLHKAVPKTKTASFRERSEREGRLGTGASSDNASTITDRVHKFTRAS